MAQAWSGATNGVWATGTNWTPSGAPGTGSNVTILGIGNAASAALTVNFNNSNNGSAPNSITFTNPTNAVSILNSSAADRSFGVGAGGITTGTGAVVIGRSTGANGVPIALTANQSWNVGSGGLTARQRISGAFGLTKTGGGTLTLNGIINGAVVGNTYTGDTKIDAGILVLSSSNTIQNSAFDTSSVVGDATNGLRSAATTLTLGGLKGSESFASRFTTTTGGYAGLTALTLNPGTAVTHSYSGDIGNGAGALTVTKTGLGTQILGASTNTGDTAVSVGTLLFSTGAGTSGSNVTVASGATGGVLVAGLEGQHTRSGTLSLSNNSTLRIDYGANSLNTSTAPLSVNTFTLGTGITLQMDGTVTTGVPYPLVTWTTGPADTAAVNAALNPIVISGLVGIYSVSGNTLRVTFANPPPISWNTGDGLWDTTTSNWLSGVTPTTFTNPLNGVTFGDGAGVVGDPIVTLNDTFAPAGVTLNSISRNYTITGSGSIAGSLGLTLDAAHIGRLTLATDNTFTGPTEVAGGTLRLGNGGIVGSLAPSSSISLTASGTLFEVNQSDTVTQGTHFGTISGDGGFAQIGSGTTALNVNNTFTGPISITGGTLQIVTGGRLTGGAYAGNIAISSGTSFDYSGTSSQTLSGIISGQGALVKGSSSALTLSGPNTYQGSTTVNAGRLDLANVGALGATSSISMANGTTLRPTIDGVIINAPISLGGPGTTAQINAPFTASAGGTVETLTLNNPITGNGNLRLFSSTANFNTNATIVLNAESTYSGNTELNTDGTALHLSGVNLFVKLGIANALPTTTVLTLDGNVGRGNGRTVTLNLNGLNQELAGLSNGGVVPSDRNQRVDSTAPATLTINNSANFTFGGATKDTDTSGAGIGSTANALITGAISLVKNGAGTFTLGGTLTNNPTISGNTYTGTTTINAGVLRINNSTSSSSAVTVNGGDLGGTGTVGGSVTVAAAGNLAPGVTAGTLNITGDLDVSAMASGAGTLKFDLNGLAGTNDLIAVGGTLTLGTLALDDLAVNNLGGLEVGTYTLITGTGVPVGTVSGSTSLIATGFNGQLQITGNNLELVVTTATGSAYDTWKAVNAPSGTPSEDSDGDGVSNAVEFVLGGLAATKDLGKLPVFATSGGNATFTFQRAQSSIDPKTSTIIEVGTNLATWDTAPSPYTVPDGAAANNPGVTVVKDSPSVGTDTVTLTVPQSPDAKKFARLKVVITP